SRTQPGVIEGTPAYMAPEQARGQIQYIDRRTDVYALGATLYDLLAGTPPFVEGNEFDVMYRLLFDEPEPLRKRDPSIPADLETIPRKTLEKEPSRRYDSAKELADDLHRYLNGEPIAARQASLRYQLWKKLKKKKVSAGALRR